MSTRMILLSNVAGAVYLLGLALAHSADNYAAAAAHVESADYQTYVSNLEALGFPKQTMRSLVTADVVAAFAGKRAEAVAARYQNFKYWQSNPAETEARARLAAQRGAIDEEMDGVLQRLLGTDTDLPNVDREWQREEWNQELAFLAPAKLAATEAILEQYAKVNQQMKELAGGLNLTEDTNALQQILTRYQDENSLLKQVLTPDEVKRMARTTSWTANNLRHAMVHFDPTEEEYDIIFEAWQPHDERLSTIYANRQADPGSGEVYAKIKASLTAARYQQYCETWWK